MECSRDLSWCVREASKDKTKKKKEKPGRVCEGGTAEAVDERGDGEPGLKCSCGSSLRIYRVVSVLDHPRALEI